MKIHRITTRNLNSLVGNNDVDFDHSALNNCGLFAIVGPTGSGKSSLLDAISLALYGRTARLNNVNEDAIVSDGSIVTTGTSEAMAELEWSMGKDRYLSSWTATLRNTKGRKSCRIRMYLKQKGEDGAWQQISTTDKDASKKTAEILKLTFPQFTQAIVLSQGQFDQFLQMKPNERYALLEVLTHTGIFRQIGKAVFELHKATRAEKEEKEKEMQGIRILSDAELLELKSRTARLKVEIDELNEAEEQIRKAIQVKEALKSLGEKAARLEREQSDIRERITAEKPNRRLLERYDQAVVLLDDYNALRNQAQRMDQVETEINRSTADLQQSRAHKDHWMNQLASACGKPVEADRFPDTLQEFTTQVRQLDLRTTRMETEHLNTKKTLEDLFRELASDVKSELQGKEWSDPQRVSELLDRMLQSTVQDRTAAGEGDIDVLLEQLDARIRETEERIRTLDTLREKSNRRQQLQQDLFFHSDEIERHREAAGTLGKKEAGLEETLKRMRDEKDEFMVWERLRDIREGLKPGHPCPCCGSTEHPMLTHQNPAPQNPSAAITKTENEMTAVKTEREAAREQLLKSETLRDTAARDLGNLDRELEKLGKVIAQHPSPEPEKEIGLLKERQAAAKRLQKTIPRSKDLRKYLDCLAVFRTTGSALEESKAERRKSWPGEDIDAFHQELTEGWSVSQEKIRNLETSLTELRHRQAELEREYPHLESAFHARLNTLGFTDRSDFESALTIRDRANDIRQMLRTMDEKLAVISTQISDTQAEIRDHKNEDDADKDLETLRDSLSESQKEKRVRTEESTLLRHREDEHQKNLKKLDSLRQEWEQLERRFRTVAQVNELIGDNTGTTFNNYVQRLTLTRLLEVANQRLTAMMNRYRLETGYGKEKDDDADTIWVIDRQMGDEKRAVETVSGGERFVISLALALGLSDMASEQSSIENMFIDEGFGSLSPEALANAIALLENLQATNSKTIGVISHVEGLKEQIRTKIKITPTGRGHSRLEVVGPGIN